MIIRQGKRYKDTLKSLLLLQRLFYLTVQMREYITIITEGTFLSW